MRTRSSSAVESDLPSKEKHPRKPLCHKNSTHKDHIRDIGDSKADVQDEGVLSLETNEQDGLPQEVYIKSEPLCEDLWDVLDELGDILDEEHADMSIKRQGKIIDMKQGEIVDKEQGVSIYKEDELDEEEVDVPPAPSISLTDDTSLFTRRSRREADVLPFSFNGGLYKSGEISSSKESRSAEKKPVCSNILPETLVRFQNSPEQSSKRCIINAFLERRLSSENKINRRSTRSTPKEKSASQRKLVSSSRIPRYRHRKWRNSRSPKIPKHGLSPPIHRRRSSQSRDHIRSRRRSSSRDRLERCRGLSSRRKLSSRSLSPDCRSRSRYVGNSPSGRGSRDASPCIGSRHRSRRSPSVGWRRASRNSPVHRSRYRTRSTSRSTKIAVQHQIETRAHRCGRSRSRSRSARKTLQKCSRSKSKSARITQQELSRSASNSRSKSKNRPSKTVACQHSRSGSSSPQNRLRKRSRSSSQPAPTQQLNTFENRPRVPGIVTRVVEQRQPLDQPSPRPISPMVTLHDNRPSRPKEMLQYLLPTPNVPQIVFTQTHYTHTEYSSHAGNDPSSYGQRFPELGPYDLRHRLSTTRSLYYVGPNDLRHSIGEIYSPQPALYAYTEWPTGVTEQYDHSSYF
ncbi:serine/arginine repetitive matrix protein 2 [Drosophila teissieri]|uniref:serine/arginine repetitive matrix protein 2 n=1 Tax=Drosophila teissieri TaxID=7243 RepID=UPI001CBA476F|nr:serine/arginine repetitive matrix protein 2 [Drosophila teissieri]